MSNDYFKAQGWFKDYARNSQDSRGMFQRLVKEDEEAFKIASAETDKIKAMMNKKYGPGTMKYGSEIKQPEIKIPQAIFEFTQRNPAAEGGQMVKPSVDGLRPGYSGEDSYFTDRITDKERLKFLDTAAKKYGYENWKSVPITKQNEPGKRVYGDRERVLQEAKRRQSGVLTQSEVKKGKVPGNIKTGALYDPEIRQKIKDTLKKQTQATPKGERLQWIADNGKKYDNPKDFIKAYEKHFKHKLGTKADALFSKTILEKDGRISLTNIDNLKNTGAAADIFNIKPGFSEEEIFKASIIQNNPKVQNKFKNLFKDIHNNVSLYSELGPEGIVERLKSKGGNLLEDFDFIKSYSSGGEQTYGGVHRGITRNSLRLLGIPEKQIVSYQSVRKPLMALSEIIQNLKNPSFAKDFKISPSTAKKIQGQLENFLKGEGSLRKDIAKINSQLGDVKFNNIFGGVNFEHTLAKQFGKDYKYLPRNYLLKGQFTSKAFNMMKRDAFDLPLINLMKQYEQGKIPAERVQAFIDDFNSKTNNYADFKFDVDKGKLGYTSDSVTYDLSRYNDPNVARQELIDNIKLTQSDTFQQGMKKTLPDSKDQLKLFKSKEAKKILKEIEAYITDTTGKVKQPMLSSGFSGAYEMLSDDLKPVLNNPKFKAFAKTVVNTPGKFFGIGDVVLGFLDYENNLSQGMSKERAKKLAYQAMSFGAWRVGDQEYIKELKDTYLKQGGDESAFDQVISLNKQNSELMSLVEKTKEQYQRESENEKTFGTAGGPEAIKFQLDVPSASDTLKTNLSAIKNKAENMNKDFTTFKETYTGEDLTQPSKDIKSAAFENLTKERLKAFDTKSLQSDPEVGSVWNSLRTNLLNTQSIPRTLTTAVDLINPFTPLPKLDDLRSDRARYEAQLKEMKEKYPREFYLHNLQRGMDRDNPITVEAAANLAAKPELGINFSEGGITGLRSKYEYKK